jgi:hypothetical protein
VKIKTIAQTETAGPPTSPSGRGGRSTQSTAQLHAERLADGSRESKVLLDVIPEALGVGVIARPLRGHLSRLLAFVGAGSRKSDRSFRSSQADGDAASSR